MIRVLSLFDGISCGMVAFEHAGIPVTEYHACEVDKYAIKVSEANYQQIVRHGSVVDYSPDRAFDYVIGGSPCQGFSFAGKQLAFDDPRSALFWQYVRILKECQAINSNVKFLLENVRMKKEHLAVITEALSVEPVCINSALVSAQNRVRYYWCNWKVTQPEDKGLLLRDIIEMGEVDREKSYCIDANYSKGGDLNQYYNKARRQIVLSPCKVVNVNPSGNGMNGWVYSADAKSPTVTTNKGEGNKITGGRQLLGVALTPNGLRPYKNDGRKGSSSEIGTIATPENKTAAITVSNVPSVTGGRIVGRKLNPETGKRDDYSATITTQQRLELREDGKAGCMTSVQKDSILTDGITYRKLKPIECERLQTLPDNYTAAVSNAQRYKCLGNGWTVDVIAHILRGSRE